jgi:hypothetical protein
MHPVHVSVTNLEIQSENNSISLSFKVFTDDFQSIIDQLYNVKVDLNENGNYDLNKEHIDNYLEDNFTLIDNGKELIFTNTGIKTNDEAVWFFYKTTINKDLKSIVIRNSLMLDLYPDQKNLLILKYGKIERGYQFNFKKKEITINLDEY